MLDKYSVTSLILLLLYLHSPTQGWPGAKYANCKLKSKSELALVARSASFYQPEELPIEGTTTPLIGSWL